MHSRRDDWPIAPGGLQPAFSKEILPMIASRHVWRNAVIVAAWYGSSAMAQSSGNAPPPQVVTLTTRDGVQLKATYYPSPLRGTPLAKQVTPVVLLHDYKSTRAIYAPL